MQPSNATSPSPGNGNLSEHLREQIEERIATGIYAPTSRLDEVKLAQAFGVSRTPIREALIQLQAIGLVELRPRRGAIVSEIAPDRLCEMFELMAELESMSARLAARRISNKEIKALQAAHLACVSAIESQDPDAYYHLNETFHYHIYAASHNQFLAEQASLLHRRLSPYRRLQLRVRNRMSTSFAEHDQIVQAIINGDAEDAARLIREHVVVQGDRFADLLSNLKALKTSVG